MICNGTSKHTKAVISFSDNGPEAEYICGPIILPNGSYTEPDPVSVDAILQYESLYVCVCVCPRVLTCQYMAELLLSRRCCSELNIKARQNLALKKPIQQVHLTDWSKAVTSVKLGQRLRLG